MPFKAVCVPQSSFPLAWQLRPNALDPERTGPFRVQQSILAVEGERHSGGTLGADVGFWGGWGCSMCIRVGGGGGEYGNGVRIMMMMMIRGGMKSFTMGIYARAMALWR